ncbi:MAG: SDR family NAD(P)-dependent oxidoreductase [Oscillospiraceae bacterium]|nr:SDR family NAD(P)-dependent oxidoreductase [Oscillospiraceae bacterium]
MAKAAHGNRVAVVTGAAGGIGRLTAKRLLEEGYTVWCVDRAPCPADLEGVNASGVKPVQLDLNDDAGIVALAGRIVNETGGADVIVNNAGYGQYGAVETVPMETGRRQMEVNFFAPVRLIQLLLPSMRERGGGRIVNISSVAGKVYSPLSGWYCASKFALEGITDCLRIELKPFGIGVSLIEPSPIRTAWPEGAKRSLLEASEGTAYEEFARKAYRLLEGATGGKAASGADAVVKAIMKAVGAKNPKARYLAGKIARLSVVSKAMMGDRLFDAAMNSQLK